jgi:hypothetical protein
MIINDPYLSDWFISYLVKRWCISEEENGNITEIKLKTEFHLWKFSILKFMMQVEQFYFSTY